MRNLNIWAPLLLLTFVLGGNLLFGQQGAEDKVPTRGVGVGMHAHSYGFGIDLQYYFLRDNNTTITIGTSLGSVKHPRESKITSAYSDQGGKDYIYDKKNYGYVFAPTLGYGKDIIERNDFNKVNLRLTAAIGPALALLKPYYLEVAIPTTGNQAYVEIQRFDAARHNYSNIVGEADFFQGINEISVTPGAQARVSAFLDLAGNRDVIRAIEFSGYANVFSQSLDLLGTTENRQFWVGGGVAFIVGNTW